MTPNQKEAFRREVLEEAAKVAEAWRVKTWGNDNHTDADVDMLANTIGPNIADEIRCLAASQPAPAADTGQAVALTYTNWRGETSVRTIVPLSIWFGSTDWHPDPQWLLKAIDVEKGAKRDFALKDFGNRAPAADTGQAVADAKFAIRVAFRKAIRDLPEIAPKEVQAALASVLTHDAFLAEGKRLQRLHGLDAVAPRVEQECAAGAWSFMRQGIIAATHPAPLDAERVREDERDRLMSEAVLPREFGPGAVNEEVWSWLGKYAGAMNPAERAALRQKEGEA